jgi:hypothetical protein
MSSCQNLNCESGVKVRTFENLGNLTGKKDLVNFLANVKGANLFDRYNPALNYLKQT